METLSNMWYVDWLVVKNAPSIFMIFDISGYIIRRARRDFVADIVGDLKSIYIRKITLHSYIFIVCVAEPMFPIALVEYVFYL